MRAAPACSAHASCIRAASAAALSPARRPPIHPCCAAATPRRCAADCSPGFMASNSTNGTISCSTCVKGKICRGAGKNGEALVEDCPAGLTTYITGAKSHKQVRRIARCAGAWHGQQAQQHPLTRPHVHAAPAPASLLVCIAVPHAGRLWPRRQARAQRRDHLRVGAVPAWLLQQRCAAADAAAGCLPAPGCTLHNHAHGIFRHVAHRSPATDC